MKQPPGCTPKRRECIERTSVDPAMRPWQKLLFGLVSMVLAVATVALALRLAALGSDYYGRLSLGARRIAMALLAACSAVSAVAVVVQRRRAAKREQADV